MAYRIDDNARPLLDEAARRDFQTFVILGWPGVNGGNLLEWNWHHAALVQHLEDVRAGKTQRLLVNLPPRSAKSILISVLWVAWMLGQDPTLNFVCVSYSSELANKLARMCLEVMQSPLHRRLFPQTKIKRTRTAAYDFETTRGGGRLATSPGGTLTGRGGDILILDDPTKPADAMSDVLRSSAIDWYRSTLLSRLNDKRTGVIICVQQRLHEEDLSGVILEAGGWVEFCLPAIATDDQTVPLTRGKTHFRKAGELLHPERESQAILDQLKADMGSIAFEAQYQQNPLPLAGNLFKSEWLETYTERPERGEIVQSYDTASKTGLNNDFSACVTALIVGDDIYIIDVYRKRLEFPDLVAKVNQLAIRHNANVLLIEDAASGTQLFQTLKGKREPGVPLPKKCTASTDKATRASGVSSMVESGRVLFPMEAPWLEDFKRELLSFPSGKHDDQVDAFTQLLEWVRDRYRGRVRTKYRSKLVVINHGDDPWE